MLNRKNFFLAILLSAVLFLAACGSVGSDGEDVFKTINFDPIPRGELLSTKSFSFDISGDHSGEGCIAIAWDGSVNKAENVFGFAVRTADNKFSLIVYFPKNDNSLFSGSITLAPGDYTAIMRQGDTIYSNPTSSLSLTVTRDSENQTTITALSDITFKSPSSITLRKSGDLILQSY